MQRLLKRLVDFIMACTLLVLVSPLLALVAILIKLDTPGPVFFVQERIGYQGKPFQILKFRSMTVSKPEDYSQQTFLDDPYVTRTGKFIRRFKIDELPQLWHVVTGEMSLVGPRPTLPEQVARYTEQQKQRLEVPPGISGWAQVNGGIQLSWNERIQLDLWYIDNWSIWLDLQILLMTAGVVLFGEKRRDNRKQ